MIDQKPSVFSAATLVPVSIVGALVIAVSFAVRTYHLASGNRSMIFYDRNFNKEQYRDIQSEIRSLEDKVNLMTTSLSSIDASLRHILISVQDLKKEQVRMRVDIEKDRERERTKRSP